MADVVNTQKSTRLQFTDSTGAKLNANLKTDAKSVLLSDGTRLIDWMNSADRKAAKTVIQVLEHLSMQHLTAAEISGLLTGISYDETTGKIKYTKYDGSSDSLNTALNKIAVNFTMEKGDASDEAEKGKVYLVLTLEDNTNMKVNVTELVDVYGGTEGDMVTITISAEKKISAGLKDGSIPITKLTQEVQDKINETYVLPVGDSALGGVKNGGTVRINVDGSMDAEVIKLNDMVTTMKFTTNKTPNVTCNVEMDSVGPLNIAADGTAAVSVTVGQFPENITVTSGVVKVFCRPISVGTVTTFTEFGTANVTTRPTDGVASVACAITNPLSYFVSGVNYEFYAVVNYSCNMTITPEGDGAEPITIEFTPVGTSAHIYKICSVETGDTP